MKNTFSAGLFAVLSAGCVHTERHVFELAPGPQPARPSQAIVSTESLDRPFRETKILYVSDSGNKASSLEKLRQLGTTEGCDGVVLTRVHEGQITQASGICVVWRDVE
ncbi:MAG: hypothetical protein KBF88_09815 [Polyangiaceae bacterium]|nr:hypothetical protein [Polyangiaceae bacterium]